MNFALLLQMKNLPRCYSKEMLLRQLVNILSKFTFPFLLFIGQISFSQTGIIKGQIIDERGMPLPFANVVIAENLIGTTCDNLGYFILENVDPGIYSIRISYLGYEPKIISEIQISNNNPSIHYITLFKQYNQLGEADVKASAFEDKNGSYNSIKSLGITEIERAPGANRDLSKVLQSLPGVAQGVRCRNDLIIRGGGPSENRFYLEDIETPNINHFATQGATGGPIGMIDVNYISDIEFNTGTIPSQYGNSLGSVLKIKFKEPRDDRIGLRATVGASDWGLAVESPITKKSSFFFTARRSYLQFLFAALDLPFLPTYTDAQYFVQYKHNDRDEFYTIFLGAYDVNALNLTANQTVDQQYILSFLPEDKQWNYTNGYVWKHFFGKGYSTVVASRNYLNNRSQKYHDNEHLPSKLLLDYFSTEAENKLRIETTQYFNDISFQAGLNYEHDVYTNSTYHKYTKLENIVIDEFETKLNVNKFGGFAQMNKKAFQDKLSFSAGFRMDANDYSKMMNNPFDQLSPRLSFAYRFSPSFTASIAAGTYYQLPPYTVLGYRDSTGTLVNKSTGLRYINAKDVVANISWLTDFSSIISLEGFYKRFSNYPFLLSDSIAMVNRGDYFEILGNEPVDSRAKGFSYGLEFLYHQKLLKGFYGMASYTYLVSQFTDRNENYVPSSWDSRHNIAITAGKQFKRHWQMGLRWRFSSGQPYTPLDLAKSSLISNYDVDPTGIENNSRMNSTMLPVWNNLDLRLDKRWYFKSWSLNVYLDIQNVFDFESELPPILVQEKDDLGNPIVDPENPDSYQTYLHYYGTGRRLNSIGIIIEY